MQVRHVLGLGALLAAVVGSATVRADGLPVCRVRVVKSVKAEAVAQQVVKEVESWVDVRHSGCLLVPSIQEADLLLELHDYTPFRVQGDGMPVQEWWFIVRQLGQATPDRGIYRFILAEPWPAPARPRHASQRLAEVLGDACLGLPPRQPPIEVDRR